LLWRKAVRNAAGIGLLLRRKHHATSFLSALQQNVAAACPAKMYTCSDAGHLFAIVLIFIEVYDCFRRTDDYLRNWYSWIRVRLPFSCHVCGADWLPTPDYVVRNIGMGIRHEQIT